MKPNPQPTPTDVCSAASALVNSPDDHESWRAGWNQLLKHVNPQPHPIGKKARGDLLKYMGGNQTNPAKIISVVKGFIAKVILKYADTNPKKPPPKPYVLWHPNPQNPKELWPVCREGDVAIIAGSGGVGKSLITIDLTLTATRGMGSQSQCGLDVRGGQVLMVSYEEDFEDIRYRLWQSQGGRPPKGIAILADPDPLFTQSEIGGELKPTATWQELNAVAHHINTATDNGLSFIIIDPASAAFAGANLNDGAAVRAVMMRLTALAKATKTGVLLVAHDTKEARHAFKRGEKPGAGMVAGSGQWQDSARGVLHLTAPNSDKLQTLTCEKANHGKRGWSLPLRERRVKGKWVGVELDPNVDLDQPNPTQGKAGASDPYVPGS